MSSTTLDVTFVIAKNNSGVFKRNFGASPCLTDIRADRIVVQEGFRSSAAAYNDGIDRAKTDLIVFAHQDVYFPQHWLTALARGLGALEKTDPAWGVVGGWGVNNQGLQAGFLYSTGLGILGAPFSEPVAIDSLDEYLLILRKSSGLRFDETMPYFHFYGTDICLSAREKGRKSYAINAFCVHNTNYGYVAPGFYEAYKDLKKKWKQYLPIQTSCIRVTRWNKEVCLRNFKRACFSLAGREFRPHPRLEDPSSVLILAPAAVY